jgi:hypothetical protein
MVSLSPLSAAQTVERRITGCPAVGTWTSIRQVLASSIKRRQSGCTDWGYSKILFLPGIISVHDSWIIPPSDTTWFRYQRDPCRNSSRGNEEDNKKPTTGKAKSVPRFEPRDTSSKSYRLGKISPSLLKMTTKFCSYFFFWRLLCKKLSLECKWAGWNCRLNLQFINLFVCNS